MEMSPQLARLVAWLEKMHARVMQAEQAARDVVDDTPAYTARMQEKGPPAGLAGRGGRDLS